MFFEYIQNPRRVAILITTVEGEKDRLFSALYIGLRVPGVIPGQVDLLLNLRYRVIFISLKPPPCQRIREGVRIRGSGRVVCVAIGVALPGRVVCVAIGVALPGRVVCVAIGAVLPGRVVCVAIGAVLPGRVVCVAVGIALPGRAASVAVCAAVGRVLSSPCRPPHFAFSLRNRRSGSRKTAAG